MSYFLFVNASSRGSISISVGKFYVLTILQFKSWFSSNNRPPPFLFWSFQWLWNISFICQSGFIEAAEPLSTLLGGWGGCKGTSSVNMFRNTLGYEFRRLKKWEIALIINWKNSLVLKKSKIFCIYNNSDFSS